MISILCPTRNRPGIFKRMADSARTTASNTNNVEILAYMDRDAYDEQVEQTADKTLIGERIILTDCWNKLLPFASGPLYMQGNDDIIFRTPGWDQMVEQEFAKWPDHILMVYGSDEGMHFDQFGPHPIVHKKWIDALGYFIPPYFSSDYGDRWINELAFNIGRKKYLPFIVEHMHFLFGKAEADDTTKDRLVRHFVDRVDKTWDSTARKREEDCEKLRQAIIQYQIDCGPKRVMNFI